MVRDFRFPFYLDFQAFEYFYFKWLNILKSLQPQKVFFDI